MSFEISTRDEPHYIGSESHPLEACDLVGRSLQLVHALPQLRRAAVVVALRP